MPSLTRAAVLILVLAAGSSFGARWRRLLFFSVDSHAPARVTLTVKAGDGSTLWQKTFPVADGDFPAQRSAVASGWPGDVKPTHAGIALFLRDGGTERCELILEPIETSGQALRIARRDGGCELEAVPFP